MEIKFMADTATPSITPAQNATWTNSLNNLLTVGGSVFSGLTATNTATQTAKAAKQNAAAAGAQSNVTKYVVLAVVVVALSAVAFFFFKKR